MKSTNDSSGPIVLVDCDGVLADFIGGVLPLVNEQTGREFTHEDVDQFNFSTALGLDTHDAAKVKRRIAERGFAEHLRPFDGALEAMRSLNSIARVFVVTSPWNSSETWTYEREAWLRWHFDIRSSRVIHTSAKYLVRGDVFIDDKTDAVEEWRRHNSGFGIRWNTPHNRNDEIENATVVTTNDWSRVINLVKTSFVGTAADKAGHPTCDGTNARRPQPTVPAPFPSLRARSITVPPMPSDKAVTVTLDEKFDPEVEK